MDYVVVIGVAVHLLELHPFSLSTMEDVETEQRDSRKRRKLTTRQGVVIGVAAVAGLGLVAKLVSFLRREKPRKVEESDIHSLEAVLSGDAAKAVLDTPQFANLEEDDAHDADSSSSEGDPTQDLDANTTPRSRFNGEENGVSHPSDKGDAVQLREEKEGEHHSEDAVEPRLGNTEQEAHTKEVEELPIEDAETLPIEDVGKLPSEDVESLPTAEVQKPPTENVEKPQVERLPTSGDSEGKLDSEDDGNFQVEDAEEQGTHSVESHSEKHANGDVKNLGSDDKVKPSTEEAADADSLDAEDASEPQVKDTERLEIEGKGKHEIKESSVEAHRVDDGKNLTQN